MGAGTFGCVLLSGDVAESSTRGGGITMLDFFFGTSDSTKAVPEGVATGDPGTTGWPGVTVAGRGGKVGGVSMRFVGDGGGGGGTDDVFFTSG